LGRREDPEVHQTEDEEIDFLAPYFDSEFEDAMRREQDSQGEE